MRVSDVSKTSSQAILLQNSASFQQHKDLDVQESQILEIRCFSRSKIKLLLYLLLSLLSGGIVSLICYWKPFLSAMLMHKKCAPEDAEVLSIKNQDGIQENVKVKTIHLNSECTVSNKQLKGVVQIFKYRYLKYYYDTQNRTFFPIFYEYEQKFQEYKNKQAMKPEQIQDVKKIFGKCKMEIKVPNIFILLQKEILTPFYLFQFFAFILWMFEEYFLYAFCLLFVSFVGCAINLYETRRNLINLKEMTQKSSKVLIFRDNNWQLFSSTELVPGDLVKIQDQKVPCDLVVKQGQIIIDESTLTGESFPVVKDSIPNTDQIYKPEQYRQHTLFEGTSVIQTRGEAVGIVIRTGFSTIKGRLIRGIMFPKPNNFTFAKDSFKFVLVMFMISIGGLILAIVLFCDQGLLTEDIVISSLDLIVITVPPALPMAMTIGTSFAITRLKKLSISCISPPRVNVAGKVSMFVFDKTGTLTQDGMEIVGIRHVDQNHQLTQKIEQVSALNSLLQELNLQEQQIASQPNLQLKLLESLAACHSLNMIEGLLIGDNLEIKMFQTTGWKLESSESDSKRLIIPVLGDQIFKEATQVLRVFHFDSKLKRMGIISKNTCESSQFYFFQKGACESVVANCLEYTVPKNLQQIYKYYTQSGYRVLALAYKPLQECPDLEKVTLQEIEGSLIFLGLLILNNPMKPESTEAIEILHQANIKTLISTGDDVLTAIAIARESSIIGEFDSVHVGEINQEKEIKWTLYKPYQSQSQNRLEESNFTKNQFKQNQSISQTQDNTDTIEEEVCSNLYQIISVFSQEDHKKEKQWLAIVGDAFNYLLQSTQESSENQLILDLLTSKGKIFARMSPESKTQLICLLQETKQLVGMCGDGANDCGALKQADAGISLSQAEASVAAPFTSRIEHIGCTSMVLREGRCALITSYQCFKFMALYGMIQFTTVVCLYILTSGLSDYQFLWIDLPHIIPLAISMGYQGPYQKLTVKEPIGGLITFPILASIIGQTAIQLLAQALVIYAILPSWDGYEEIDPNNIDFIENFRCQENTILFTYSLFIYLNVVLAFSEGKPFRSPTIKSKKFVIVFSVLWLMDWYILWFPAFWTRDVLKTEDFSYAWKGYIFIEIFAHLALAVSYEFWGIPFMDRCYRSCRKKKQ